MTNPWRALTISQTQGAYCIVIGVQHRDQSIYLAQYDLQRFAIRVAVLPGLPNGKLHHKCSLKAINFSDASTDQIKLNLKTHYGQIIILSYTGTRWTSRRLLSELDEIHAKITSGHQQYRSFIKPLTATPGVALPTGGWDGMVLEDERAFVINADTKLREDYTLAKLNKDLLFALDGLHDAYRQLHDTAFATTVLPTGNAWLIADPSGLLPWQHTDEVW